MSGATCAAPTPTGTVLTGRPMIKVLWSDLIIFSVRLSGRRRRGGPFFLIARGTLNPVTTKLHRQIAIARPTRCHNERQTSRPLARVTFEKTRRLNIARPPARRTLDTKTPNVYSLSP